VAKVEERDDVATADQRPDAGAALPRTRRFGAPVPARRFRTPFVVEFYRSAIGKKWVMAVTGVIGMGYVVAHMVGNLHVFEGPEQVNRYGEWLREMFDPPFPRTFTLWMLRSVLVVAVVLHIHAAYALTRMNRRARPVGYQSRRDYVAVNFASRTMRWSGVIVGLFIVYHLLDLTVGASNPGYTRGNVYRNVVASFEQWPVALVYIAANLALGLHLYHGAWSLFQSVGWNNPRFNQWRRSFATVFAIVVTGGFISVPIAVLAGVVE
jgi:succinate dehydrogenase / fumarate reductase cytochrome b subunit